MASSRTSKTIVVRNSPYFLHWSHRSRLTAREIYDLYCLLKKYSFIVSDGSIDIKFLRESSIESMGDKAHLLLKDKGVVYINSSNIFQGKIDAVIGELIFSLIAKDAMKEVGLATLLDGKIKKSRAEVFNTDGILFAEYNLDDFLTNTLVISGHGIHKTTIGNGSHEFKNGMIKIISDFHEIEQLLDSNSESNDLAKLVLGLAKTEEKGKLINGTISNIEYILSCLTFFKKYDDLSPHIVKYCESYIKEGMSATDGSNNFCAMFRDFALVYLFGDNPESPTVAKFLDDTGLYDLSYTDINSITKIVVQYFEEGLDKHIQSMLDDIPADILMETPDVSSLKEIGALALVRDSNKLLPQNNNLKQLIFSDV